MRDLSDGQLHCEGGSSFRPIGSMDPSVVCFDNEPAKIQAQPSPNPPIVSILMAEKQFKDMGEFVCIDTRTLIFDQESHPIIR